MLHCEFIQGDQRVSMRLMIKIQKSGGQRLLDHSVYIYFLLIIDRNRHVSPENQLQSNCAHTPHSQQTGHPLCVCVVCVCVIVRRS